MKASRLLILTAAAALNFNTLGTGPGTLPGQGYANLLLFENKSDVCLNCHAGNGSYHVWSDDPTAPTVANRGGGDFVFLEEDNINDGHGGARYPILGESAGHSIISGIKGTSQDSVLASAPGGSYPSSEMGCTSCHDPHGTQAYRILYQNGQAIPNATFTATLEADGISVFAGSESNANHNAYISGYSEWCATCHTDFHQGWTASLIHPSGQTLTGDTVTKYNAYNGTQDCIDNPPVGATPCGTGTQPNAYLATVPFQDAGATTGSTAGPTNASQVACVTCHRAHATSAPDAGRWDFSVTGLAEDGHESGSYTIPNPYGDPVQRSLCNKCHTQDEFDAAVDFTP